MTYTTSAKVRTEAGFDNNADITDGTIDNYRIDAYNLMRAQLASKYILSVMDNDTGFGTTPAAALLGTIETTYAAGLLLKKEFGGDDVGLEIAQAKIKMAEDRLKRILDSEDAIILVNGSNQEYTTNNSGNTSGPLLTGISDNDVHFTREDQF